MWIRVEGGGSDNVDKVPFRSVTYFCIVQCEQHMYIVIDTWQSDPLPTVFPQYTGVALATKCWSNRSILPIYVHLKR